MLKDHWNWLLEEVKKRKWIIYSILIGFPILVLVLGITLEEVADTLVALGTISMALVIVYIEIIKPWLQKPEIKIEFKNDNPYCRHQKTGKDLGPYWCHFVVVSSGGSQADDCEAVLEKIWDSNGEKDQSKWPEREGWIPVNLKWSAEKFFSRRYYKTIYPGGRRYFCDIGRVDKLKNKIFAFELSRPFISQDNFLECGSSYKIQISVYSKNGAKATEKFKVKWSGGWKGTQPEMQELLEIKRCCRV